jgi:2,5-diketo-D-gluconate reductase A
MSASHAAPAPGTSGHPEVGHASRIAQNFDITDFELTADQLIAIDMVEAGVRGGPESEQTTPATVGRRVPEP